MYHLAAVFYILLSTVLACSPNNTGAKKPSLAISGIDYGKVFLNQAATTRIELTNNGELPLEKFSIEFLTSEVNFENTSSSGTGRFPGDSGDCGTSLAAKYSCLIALQLAPQSLLGPVTQTVRLSFVSGGISHTKNITLSAEVIDHAKLVVHNVIFNKVAINTKKVEVLTLENPSAEHDITNFQLSIPSGIFSILNPANCTTIAAKKTCKLNIEMAPIIAGVETVQGDIRYNIGSVSSKNDQIDITGEGFDDSPLTAHGDDQYVNVKKNKTYLVEIMIKHDVNGLAGANTLDVDSKLPTGFSKHASTTCMSTGNLTYGQQCKLVLESSAVTTSHAKKTFQGKIKYSVGGVVKKLQYSFSRTVAMTAPPVPKVLNPSLSILGEVFGHHTVNEGDSFSFTVKLINNSLNNITIKDFNPQGSTWNTFLSWDQSSSFCKKNTILSSSATCKFKMTISPDPLKAVNLIQPMTLTYRENSKPTDDTIVFNISGDWNILSKGQLVSGQLSPPLVIIATGNTNDRWSQYVFRPEKKNVLALMYPQDMFNALNNPAMIENLPSSGLQNMPWTFKSNNVMKFKLKDVVADRIYENGKPFIKMYHGSKGTAVLNLFKGGAANIEFDKARNQALGAGFYMTASYNEARDYACWNISKGQEAFVLVVGVEERDEIMGEDKARSTPLFSTTDGDPLDKTIYFARNRSSNNYYNQFVFFSNVKPYLKIFEIIKLPNYYNRFDTEVTDGNGRLPIQGIPGIKNTCTW